MRDLSRTRLFVMLLLGEALTLSGPSDCFDNEFFDIAVGEPIFNVSVEPTVWGAERELSIPITNRGNIPFDGHLYGGLFVESSEDLEFPCGGVETSSISIESLHLNPGDTQVFPAQFHVCRPGLYTFTVKLFSLPEDMVLRNNTNLSKSSIEYIEMFDAVSTSLFSWIDNDVVQWQVSISNNGTLPLMFGDGDEHVLVHTQLIPPDGGEGFESTTSYLYFFLAPLEQDWASGRFLLENRGWYTLVVSVDPDDLFEEVNEENNVISAIFEH